jgi:UDP-N-acetylglucosamine transferase subunit ALG13
VAWTFRVFSKGKVFGEAVLIFLTVGSWHRGYNRLIKAVDELVGCGVITDEVIAQTGNGSYKPKHLTTISFCSPDEFVNFISRSRVVISHAGVGTIAQAVKKFKPVVVVPRKASLGEHFDDHQFVTAETFEKEGKVLVAYEVDELVYKIQQTENFIPNQTRGTNEILYAVQEFIDSIIAKKQDW